MHKLAIPCSLIGYFQVNFIQVRRQQVGIIKTLQSADKIEFPVVKNFNIKAFVLVKKDEILFIIPAHYMRCFFCGINFLLVR
jgi:hypothetical protein